MLPQNRDRNNVKIGVGDRTALNHGKVKACHGEFGEKSVSADEVCGSAKDTDTILAVSEQRVSFEMRINLV